MPGSGWRTSSFDGGKKKALLSHLCRLTRNLEIAALKEAIKDVCNREKEIEKEGHMKKRLRYVKKGISNLENETTTMVILTMRELTVLLANIGMSIVNIPPHISPETKGPTEIETSKHCDHDVCER